MKIGAGVSSFVLFVLLGLFGGCTQEPEGWSPVLEETSTAFLEAETQRIRDHVGNALQSLDADPGRATAELLEAESTLEHLQDYYLPLLRAREAAYNAYRRFYMEDEEGVAQDLADIERILTEMATEAEGQRLLEIEALGEEVANTRMATASGSEQGQDALESLARRLNQAALKGDLILR